MRHARPVVDATVPPAAWNLADGASVAAAELGRHLRGTRVLASIERKAIATAEALGLGPVTTSDAFCEVERPWYDDGNAMAADAARWLAGERLDDWEGRGDAIRRFDRAIIDLGHEGLVVVTHGTVMTAWLSWNRLVDDPYAFWSGLTMPDAWEVGRTLVRCP